MKGKFYYADRQELLATVLDAWPAAERLSLKEAFMTKILSSRFFWTESILRKGTGERLMQGFRLLRIAGLVGVLGPAIGLSAAFISTLLCGPGCGDEARAWSEWAPGGAFSWSINALSDLGVSRVSGLFNYPLILVGVLNFIFAYGFVRAYARSALFYVGGGLLILGGASLSLVGIFTEAYGALHSYVSLGYFVLFPLAMILVGPALMRMKMKTEAFFSILAGVFSLLVIVGGLVLRWHLWLGLGFAVPEIIEAIIIASWVCWMGLGLVRLSWKTS